MANDLVLLPEINEPYLLNDNKEKQIKVRISVMPSQEIREKFTPSLAKSLGSDICIVLDVSGTMRFLIEGKGTPTGETRIIDGKKVMLVKNVKGAKKKLDVALAAIERLIPLLRENDTLSMIAYDDTPHVLFKGYSVRDKDLMLEKLKECWKYDGNTNISGALREARMLLSSFSKERPKKIIFLTDGQPEGDTEENGIREGKLLAEYNISIDCLGFGNDFNYGFIEKVVAPSKGRANIIKTSSDAEQLFEELFRKSQDVVATNAKLSLTFSPQVRVTEHYRGTPENLYLGKVKLTSGQRTFTLDLGQIECNQKYDYYFLVTVPPQVGYKGAFRVMKAEADYFIPAVYGQETGKTVKNIVVEFGDNQGLLEVNGDVEKGFALAEIKRLEDEADEAKNAGRDAEVLSRYEEIIQRYESLGMADEIKAYRKVLEAYSQNRNVSLEVMNDARRTSSQAAEKGTLTKPIDKEFEDNIFGF